MSTPFSIQSDCWDRSSPPLYLAKEVILELGCDSTECQKRESWWTISCWELPHFVDFQSYFTKNKEIEIPAGGTPELGDLIIKLLIKDPNTRLGSSEWDADEIMEHPWFSQTDWSEMIDKKTKPPYTP